MNDFILVTAVSEMEDGLGRVISFRKMLDQIVKYNLEILVSYKGENLEKWRLDYPQKNIFFNLQKSTSGIGAAVAEVFGMACVKFYKNILFG
jgi:hypothetical protein